MTLYETKETNIYALVDPRTPTVIRYIGKTIKPVRVRMQEHVADAKRGKQNYRCNWIRKLIADGVRPMVILLQTVNGDGSAEERAVIASMRAASARITNATDGGGN